jgi:hypothetical protein
LSLPTFPDKPEGYTVEDSISQILTSIAMEEIGLSHILNSEGEKLQYILGTLENVKLTETPTIAEILEVNESIKEMLEAVSQNQMFLFAKMTSALSAYFKNRQPPGATGADTPPKKPEKPPITDTPTPIEGRILTPEQTGDGAPWVEIARNGGYSLLVRTQFINTFAAGAQQGNPDYQAGVFGTDNSYDNSRTRQKINDWFMGSASADKLPANANLRSFAVKSDALTKTGVGTAGPGGKDDSFSKPTDSVDPAGQDVAFALSYGEAANFISNQYGWGGDNVSDSTQAAQSNFAKLSIPEGNQLWLRSPGTTSDMVSSLSASGKVFQAGVDGTTGGNGLLYPALWADSDIFDA